MKNPRKTQAVLKNLEETQGCQKKIQKPKIGTKNPRSWEKTQAVATLIVTPKFNVFSDFSVGLIKPTSHTLNLYSYKRDLFKGVLTQLIEFFKPPLEML